MNDEQMNPNGAMNPTEGNGGVNPMEATPDMTNNGQAPAGAVPMPPANDAAVVSDMPMPPANDAAVASDTPMPPASDATAGEQMAGDAPVAQEMQTPVAPEAVDASVAATVGAQQVYPEAAPVGMDATAQMMTNEAVPTEAAPTEVMPTTENVAPEQMTPETANDSTAQAQVEGEQVPIDANQIPADANQAAQAVGDAGQVAQMPADAGQETQVQADANQAEQAVGDAGQVAQTPDGAGQTPAAQDPKNAKKAGGLNEKMQKFSEWFKTADFNTLFAKKEGKNLEETSESFEINLVPAVKSEALQATRLRNLILFVCLIIVGVVGGGVAILGTTYGAQSLTISAHSKQIDEMSEKINSFEGLEGYLTIKDQLGGISSINENKQVLSRVFTIVGAMQPSAPDKVTFSEMTVDLEKDTIMLKGQADAGAAPWIDFNVLQAFKKTMEEMKFDYGHYVSSDGTEIPSRCMVENNANGDTLTSDGSEYAYWMVTKDGCDTQWTERADAVKELEDEIAVMKAGNNTESEAEDGAQTETMSDEEIKTRYQEIYDQYKGEDNNIVQTWYDKWLDSNNLTRYTDDSLSNTQISSKNSAWNAYYGGLNDEEKWIADMMVNDYEVAQEDVSFEKIYRTPQFKDWYHGDDSDEQNYMSLDGSIAGIPHFESECTKYTGMDTGDEIQWEITNSCMLLDGELEAGDPSNTRDADGTLVLSFNVTMTLNKEVLLFTNKHVMAVLPGVKNVTGSYTQIQQMFGEAAKDCQSSDVECVEKKANEGGDTPTVTPTQTPEATATPEVTTVPVTTPNEENE